MTEIYVVRHCEAKGNEKRLFQGAINCNITELGEKQLEFLTERFKDVKLDKIYTSPLYRAQKTAFAVMGERNMDIKIENDLREVCGGILEGKPFMDMYKVDPALADAWDNHPQDFYPEKGEHMRDAYERIFNIVLKLAKENDGNTIALACHGGVIRCLMARLIFGTIDRLKDVPWAENTSVALLTFDNGEFTVHYKNDHSHLPDEFLPVRHRLVSYMKKD